jgi:hypothetical protein
MTSYLKEPGETLRNITTKATLVSAIASALAVMPGGLLAGTCDRDEFSECADECNATFDVEEAVCNHDLAVAMDECDAWWNILNRSECRRTARAENTECIASKWNDRNFCRDECREWSLNDCS